MAVACLGRAILRDISLAICLAGCEERSQELEERVTQLQKELNRTQDELRSTKHALDATNEELARLKAASNSASASAPTPASVAQVKPDSAASTSINASASGQRPVVNPMPADRSVMIQWPDSGASAPASQNVPAPARANAAAAAPQQSGVTAPGGASNRTVVIQWPGNNGPAPSTNQASAPSGAANPPARSVQQPASSSTGPLGSNCHHSMARQRAIAASAKLKQCAPNSAARRKSSLAQIGGSVIIPAKNQ